MTNFTFTQEPRDFAEKLDFLRREGIYYSVGRAAMLAKEMGLEALRQEAPKRTGAFAKSIIAKQYASAAKRSVRVEFYGAHPLARFIIEGTRAHIIEPRRARALRWETNGEVHFARRVHHPGTKPNPFQVRALERIKDRLPRGFADSVKQQLDTLGAR